MMLSGLTRRRFDLFAVFGAPCCEHMAEWLSIQRLKSLSRVNLAHSFHQADLLVVVGIISHKQAPMLQRLYHQMAYPTHCLHLLGCAKNRASYASVQNLADVITVNATITQCPVKQSTINKSLQSITCGRQR